MITVRKELEDRLIAFAAAQVPPLKIALEDIPFTKPSTPFLECVIVPAATYTYLDGNRITEFGVMQVNVWYPEGNGAIKGETLANKVIAAFPMVPRVGTVSVVQTPYKSRAMMDEAGWRIIPVTISYRQEGEVVAS